MMKPAVHIMVGSKEMHDNMEKALIDAVEHVKNAPIQGRFTDAFEKERGMSINESMAKDNSIMICSSKDEASNLRWINMANRLNYLN
jgi:hypothetical protein